jgi:DNA repair protein RecO (recombination protein O)
LLELAVEPEHAEPALFDLLRRALDHLAAKPPTLRALNHFESELARLLGVLHDSQPAATCLGQAIGSLPPNRKAVLALLGAAT